MFLKAQPRFLAFEGEDDAAAKKAADEAAAAAAAAAEEKQFTQGDVNTFLAADKRKLAEKQRKLAEELEQLKRTASLTKKEKTELATRIDELQTQSMTAEEKARREVDRAKKEYNEKLQKTTDERDSWKNKHSQLAINTEIMQAADANGALHNEQISALIAPRTKLIEKTDEEGQLTGEYEPKVTFADLDKNKKPITLELTIPEAVTRMTELDQYSNLFETAKKSGLGGTGSTRKGKKIDIAHIARTDTKEYRRLHKERPDLFE